MLKHVLFAVLFLISRFVFAEGGASGDESLLQIVGPIGQKICSETKGNDVTMTQPSPWIANTFLTYKGHAELVGFVEKYSGDKIQIRIAGMTFAGSLDVPDNISTDSIERVPMRTFDNYKGLSLQIGSVIWDDYRDWFPCR